MNYDQSKAELTDYFRASEGWAQERNRELARSRKIAWVIAGIAVTIALFESIALAMLTPLKTVVPYTVLVDRQTGYVTAIDPLRPAAYSGDLALTKSLLAQYVTARESIDRGRIRDDYRKVMLWSGGQARTSYANVMQPNNPANPLTIQPAQTVRQIAIKSVSPLRDGQAMVRFDAWNQGLNGVASTAFPQVAILSYRYRNRPLSEGDRLVNPLGFEVLSYQRDAETVPAPIAQPQSPPAPLARP